MTTITAALNAGNFSQATSLASDLMPGNQQILDAIAACAAAQSTLTQAVEAALVIAAGN
jgi:hypothetical protein